MNGIDSSTTLAALVSGHPELARVLERHELDYCCGGQQSLAEACDRLGLDRSVVVSALVEAQEDGPAPDWASMGPCELIDHLVDTHHRYLWDEMPRLSALMAKVLGVHGERHPELTTVASAYEAIRSDLEPHLLKEEQVLFPMVRELATAETPPAFHCGSLRNPIAVMLREHDRVGDLLATLRAATDGYRVPADGCASYAALWEGLSAFEADTHLHVHKENNLLFPMVVQMEAE